MRFCTAARFCVRVWFCLWSSPSNRAVENSFLAAITTIRVASNRQAPGVQPGETVQSLCRSCVTGSACADGFSCWLTSWLTAVASLRFGLAAFDVHLHRPFLPNYTGPRETSPTFPRLSKAFRASVGFALVFLERAAESERLAVCSGKHLLRAPHRC